MTFVTISTRRGANVPPPLPPRMRQKFVLESGILERNWPLIVIEGLISFRENMFDYGNEREVIKWEMDKGLTNPYYDAKTMEEFEEIYAQVKNCPRSFMKSLVNFFKSPYLQIKPLLDELSIEIRSLSDDQKQAFNFMMSLYSKNIPTLCADLTDPSGKGDHFGALEQNIETYLECLENSYAATKYKNEVVAPYYISRLRELMNCGLQLSEEHLKTCEELIYGSKVIVEQLHDQPEVAGTYNGREVFTRLDRFDGRSLYNPAKHDLVHELNHLISSASNIAFTLNEDGEVVESYRVGLRHIAYEFSENSVRMQALQIALNEAFTESLAVWIMSGLEPDFTNMTVREFFDGPFNLSGVYTYERSFFMEMIGDMPIHNLTKAYFEDYVGWAHEDCTTPSDLILFEEIKQYYPGGLEGLAEIFVPFEDFTVKDNLPEQFSLKPMEFDHGR